MTDPTPCIFCDCEDEPMTDIAVVIEIDGSETTLSACDDLCTGIWANAVHDFGFSYAVRHHFDGPTDAAYRPLWTGDSDE